MAHGLARIPVPSSLLVVDCGHFFYFPTRKRTCLHCSCVGFVNLIWRKFVFRENKRLVKRGAFGRQQSTRFASLRTRDALSLYSRKHGARKPIPCGVSRHPSFHLSFFFPYDNLRSVSATETLTDRRNHNIARFERRELDVMTSGDVERERPARTPARAQRSGRLAGRYFWKNPRVF